MIITANNIMNRSVEGYGAVKSRLKAADESGSRVRAEGTDTGDAFRSGPVYPDSGLMKRELTLSSADKADRCSTDSGAIQGSESGTAGEASEITKDDAYWQEQFKTFLQQKSFINGDCSWGNVVTVSDRNSRDGMIALAFATGGYTGTETSLVSYPKELGAPINGDGTFVNSAGMKVYFFDLKANPFLQPGADMVLKFNTSPMGGGSGLERNITLRLAGGSN